ncbi:hypothetical protein [Rhodobium gokarnense]|uniref:Uncharacterized protein n=1 Tax=Rhodobium gokarnense TaxID=364296 RepID=A0ABT3HHQ7_9HYPH|nr:hypothetical protein [Rhodobium gokarnense]MCW2309939.1 hypothetical protein [Rhodobium gokarnense]
MPRPPRMLSRALLLRLALWMPMAVAASLIVYIFLGVEGRTWVAQAVDVSRNAGYFINLFGFVLILAARRYLFLGVNILFSLSMLACAGLGVLDAFPGTGARYGNHGADATAAIGLVNYLVLSLALPKQGRAAFAALASAFPVVAIAAYVEITAPLAREFDAVDAKTTCMFRTRLPVRGAAKVERIDAFSDLDLGYVVGERSPRVAKVKGGEAYLWRYGAREFSKAFDDAGLPSTLPSDLVRRCAAERENR